MMTVHVMRIRQRLARQVVLLADELVVVQDVELLSGAHLLPTHQAGEAIQVENLVPRLPHEILRAYPLEATAAFRAVSPANRNEPAKRANVNNDKRQMAGRSFFGSVLREDWSR